MKVDDQKKAEIFQKVETGEVSVSSLRAPSVYFFMETASYGFFLLQVTRPNVLAPGGYEILVSSKLFNTEELKTIVKRIRDLNEERIKIYADAQLDCLITVHKAKESPSHGRPEIYRLPKEPDHYEPAETVPLEDSTEKTEPVKVDEIEQRTTEERPLLRKIYPNF